MIRIKRLRIGWAPSVCLSGASLEAHCCQHTFLPTIGDEAGQAAMGILLWIIAYNSIEDAYVLSIANDSTYLCSSYNRRQRHNYCLRAGKANVERTTIPCPESTTIEVRSQPSQTTISWSACLLNSLNNLFWYLYRIFFQSSSIFLMSRYGIKAIFGGSFTQSLSTRLRHYSLLCPP